MCDATRGQVVYASVDEEGYTIQVEDGTVQCSTVKYSEVQCSTMQFNLKQQLL